MTGLASIAASETASRRVPKTHRWKHHRQVQHVGLETSSHAGALGDGGQEFDFFSPAFASYIRVGKALTLDSEGAQFDCGRGRIGVSR